MSEPPFHIPHILQAVAETLTFSDLLNCILVNHHWHTYFIPVLWTDTITFRSRPTTKYRVWTYLELFRTPHGQQGLLKHAHHIRAITCQGSRALQLLKQVGTANLHEINYVIDNQALDTETGLEDLADLIAINPQLASVSVENLALNAHDNVLRELSAFVDFLDQHPQIANVHFEPHRYVWDSYRDQWADLWFRLISRTPTNVSHITIRPLLFVNLPRSDRSQGYRLWPARQSSLRWRYPTVDVRHTYFAQSGTRWENERYQFHASTGAMAVFFSRGDDTLTLYTPHMKVATRLMHVLQGFSALQTLKIISLEQPELRIIVPAIPRILPNLSHVDLPVYHSHAAPLDKFIDDVRGLSSIGLDLRSNEHLVGKVLSKFSGALTRLHLGLVTMSQFFSVAASCSVLQELIVGNLVITDSEQTAVSPCWIVCLRKFVVRIQYGKNHNVDSVPEYVLERQFARSVAPSFMEQLGSLEMLQELSIQFGDQYKPGDWPFLELTVDGHSGLPRLAGLKQLRTVAFAGLKHRVGEDEIRWMARHWKQLESLELPLLREDGELQWGDAHDVAVPDYSAWFPGLQAIVAKICYGCAVCKKLFCWEERFDDWHEWLEMYYNLQVSMNRKDVEALEENELERGTWATIEDYRAFKNQHRLDFIGQHRKVSLWRHEEYKKRHQPNGSRRQ